MEIERKFLVRSDDYKRCAHKSYRIKQGYISSGNGRTVRVRIRDNQGFLTIKGPSLDDGLSHYEFEHEISLEEAQQLFRLCEPRWRKPSNCSVSANLASLTRHAISSQVGSTPSRSMSSMATTMVSLLPKWSYHRLTNHTRSQTLWERR